MREERAVEKEEGGEKRGRKLSRNRVTKESVHIYNFFFLNLSLLMDSVLYRVLLHQGQSLQSSEKNLRETSLKITMIKSTL